MQPSAEGARPSPYILVESLLTSSLRSSFSAEYARLKRNEWRRALAEYARPFFDERVRTGRVGPSSEYAVWLEGWVGSILHVHRLLSGGRDGSPPALGLNATGDLVSAHEAVAPPLPMHPFPEAEAHDELHSSSSRADGGEEGARDSGYDARPSEYAPARPYNTPRREARARFAAGGVYYDEGMGRSNGSNATSSTVPKPDAQSTQKEEPLFGVFR